MYLSDTNKQINKNILPEVSMWNCFPDNFCALEFSAQTDIYVSIWKVCIHFPLYIWAWDKVCPKQYTSTLSQNSMTLKQLCQEKNAVAPDRLIHWSRSLVQAIMVHLGPPESSAFMHLLGNPAQALYTCKKLTITQFSMLKCGFACFTCEAVAKICRSN